MRTRALVALVSLVATQITATPGWQRVPASQLQESGSAKGLESAQQAPDTALNLADQTGPNCGRPTARVTLSLIRAKVKEKSQPILRLDYASDQVLGLKPFQAPLLLTTNNKKNVKPTFMPFSMIIVGSLLGPVKMELFYSVKPGDLVTLSQATTVQGRLQTKTKGGECQFEFFADAPERIRSFLAADTPR